MSKSAGYRSGGVTHVSYPTLKLTVKLMLVDVNSPSLSVIVTVTVTDWGCSCYDWRSIRERPPVVVVVMTPTVPEVAVATMSISPTASSASAHVPSIGTSSPPATVVNEDVIAIVGALPVAATVSVNDSVSLSLSASVTVTVMVCVPLAVGVPESVRSESVSHDGLPLTLYTNGAFPPVAAPNVSENAVPITAVWLAMAGRTGVVSGAATVSVNDSVSLSLLASVTVTVMVCVPLAVGVPESVRSESVSHDGLPLTLYTNGAFPPVAAPNVSENAMPVTAVWLAIAGRTGVVSSAATVSVNDSVSLSLSASVTVNRDGMRSARGRCTGKRAIRKC